MEKYVEINGHQNFVYCYGHGSTVLVLLSGSGVPFPSLEYKTLAESLAETYQVIGIEKLGYGYSDLAEDSRTIDIVVDEYRAVLQVLGIKTPVVLAAHSMGFLEALRWAQQYPSEIAGILGIDPAVPECYKTFDVEDATNKLIALSQDEPFRKTTATALVKQLAEGRDISFSEQKKLEGFAFRNLANQNWIDEAKNLRDSIILVEKNNPYLQIPMLFFISNGVGTTLEKETWIQYATQYLKHIEIAQYTLFDYPHNLYQFVYKEISQITRSFISQYIEKK